MRAKLAIALTLVIVCLAAASIIRAAPEEPFELTWWTVDDGGATSSGGSYILSGTIGQADAHCASNGSYLITGGFWNGAVIKCQRVYLPVVRK